MSLATWIQRGDEVFLNPAKRYVKPHWITTDPEEVIVPANQQSDAVLMNIDYQGHFEAFYFLYQSTGDFLISIFDNGTRRLLMNDEIHIATIAGTAQRPFILPESYFFNTEDAGTSLIVKFRDISGANNSIRFAIFGRRFYHKEATPDIQKKIYEKFGRLERTNLYFLTTEGGAISLSPGGSTRALIRNTDEAETEIFKLTAVSTGAFKFKMKDSATGRYFMNDYIHSNLAFGNGQYPFILSGAETLIFVRNYQAEIEIVDLSGAANTIYLTLTGRRLYHRA